MSHSLSQLADPDVLIPALQHIGLPTNAAAEKTPLFTAAATALLHAGHSADQSAHAFWVPGRIEVLGKHTDYAGGQSLVAAIDRGQAWIACPSPPGKGWPEGPGEGSPNQPPHANDKSIYAFNPAANESATLPLLPPDNLDLPGWPRYLLTAVRRLAHDFPNALTPVSLAFASDLPPAAGISSSSALICGAALALAAATGLDQLPQWTRHLSDRIALAQYFAALEAGRNFPLLNHTSAASAGVGTRGGSEDHTAILAAKPNTLSLFRYCPTMRLADIPFPADHTFVIATSGVIADKTGRAKDLYNRAADLAKQLAQIWRDHTHRTEPHLAAIALAGRQHLDRLCDILAHLDSPALQRRLDHFLEESESLVPAAASALAEFRFDDFARLTARSQLFAESLLQNQTPETSFLAQTAQNRGQLPISIRDKNRGQLPPSPDDPHPPIAASAFGAGFGGAVWALVPRSIAADFLNAWKQDYNARFPQHAPNASFFLTSPGPPASRI